MKDVKIMKIVMWLATIAGNVGSLASALITLFAYRYAKKEITYFKKQHYESANELLIKLEESLKFIGKIIEAPDLYRFEGYYPFQFPEIPTTSQPHDVRPWRLIFNRMKKVENDISALMYKIDKKDHAPINELVRDMKKITKDVLAIIAADQHSEPIEIKKQYASLIEYQEKLSNIITRAKELFEKISAECR